MPWINQVPSATDVLAVLATEYAADRIEIDKLPNGRYRATRGNFFGSEEVAVDASLEELLRMVLPICWPSDYKNRY